MKHRLAWVRKTNEPAHTELLAKCTCGDLYRLVPITFSKEEREPSINLYDIESPRLRGYLRERFKEES